MKPRIIIQVRGGLIADIISDCEVDVHVFDWDNVECIQEVSDLYTEYPARALSRRKFNIALKKVNREVETQVAKNQAYEKDHNH